MMRGRDNQIDEIVRVLSMMSECHVEKAYKYTWNMFADEVNDRMHGNAKHEKETSLMRMRKDRGIKAFSMADILGISLSEYEGYEKDPGAVPTPIAVKLCAILECKLKDIMRESKHD